MSSQENEIILSHVPDDTGYRLIELPMELQLLLESDAAPTSVTYQAIPLKLPSLSIPNLIPG